MRLSDSPSGGGGQTIGAGWAAGLLGVPRTNVPNLESGRSGISAARVRTLAANYGCTDEAYIEALAAIPGEREKGWWEAYRDQLPAASLDIAEMEWHSPRLRIAVTIHLPGLFQTADHARAVFAQVVPRLPRADLEARLAHRMDRKQVLEKPDPPRVEAIIHEAALRMEFGGTRTTRAQLRHIVELTERPQLSVRVIPFKAGGFPGSGQSVIYAAGAVPQLDTIELDTTHGAEFHDDVAQLAKYRAQLDELESRALSRDDSRNFMSDLASRL
uniref:DUF5753 domain-containing protein n=1 Tax=Streptomyces sp. NBC_00003 TaxID=2903608 RepID=A0AAU2V377_9ACTN